MDDLTPDFQVCLSWGSIAESFHSLRSLSQLLPCHLGPTRPTPSINLSVTGCLDYTVGAFHVSTQAEPPSGWGPNPQWQAAQVAHWTWLWQCLAAWHCRSIWSLPCHSAAAVGGLALSWPSLTGMELYTPHTRDIHAATCLERVVAGRENWQQLLELLPGGFHVCCDWNFTASGCWEHVSYVAPPQACQVRLGRSSVVCRLRGVQFPGTMYFCNRVLCQALEPTAFLVHSVLTAFAENAVAAHSIVTDGA